MKLFELRRTVDESGVSGTGTVAQGVIFDNGWCALTWLTEHTSVAFYTSIEEVIAIHGHNGKTVAVQTANCDRERVQPLRENMAQDYLEGVNTLFRKKPYSYMWEQREKFVDLFKERELEG